MHDLKEQHVEESKTKKTITKVVLCRYSYCSVKKCHQGKVVSIKNPTMNLNGNTTTPDIQVHGGMKVMYGDIGYHKYNNKTHDKSCTRLRWL